jgi:hypothetical protein
MARNAAMNHISRNRRIRKQFDEASECLVLRDDSAGDEDRARRVAAALAYNHAYASTHPAEWRSAVGEFTILFSDSP